MNCARLMCKCECGSYAQPINLWLTDQKQLLVTCLCVSCEERMNVVFPFADLFKGCPKPEIPKKVLDEAISTEITRIADGPIRPPLQIKEPEWTEVDKVNLHALGVRTEDECDNSQTQ